MRIELRCGCGATAVFSDPRSTYLVNGGVPDADGDVFRVERAAREWRQQHAGCLPLRLTACSHPNAIVDWRGRQRCTGCGLELVTSAIQQEGHKDECPEDCLMCSGEACNKCGAGCWSHRTDCEHGVLERHEAPPDA